MMIAPSDQRQGIGTLMIKELEKHIGDKECFCLPHGWLESFYGQIGFKKVSENQIPEHLAARLLHNRKKNSQLIAMLRK